MRQLRTYAQRHPTRLAVLLGATALLLLYGWYRLGYVRSPYEVLAAVRLQQSVAQGQAVISLEAVMPGEWERVCYLHAYLGPLEQPHYNRTYHGRAYPNDDGWDLFFIARDGGYRGAAGNCPATGMVARRQASACVAREGARLVQQPGGSAACPQYALDGQAVQ